MGRIVSIDGELTAPERATVSIYDRGFLYGDAVFEVLRTYGGVPFALAEHVARLRRSAGRVKMHLPVADSVVMREVMIALAEAGEGEHYARIMLTRGCGPLGLDIDLATHPLRVILVEPVHSPAQAMYAEGVQLITVCVERAVDGTAAAGSKVTNYLASMLALHEAKARGAAEALIVDARGNVIEGASSNLFIVRYGRLCTPPESAGILAGITRAHLLIVAAELSIPVDLVLLTPAELLAADEVFVTSSIREVLPGVVVDGHRIGKGVPGTVTRLLHTAFRRRVGITAKMPWES